MVIIEKDNEMELGNDIDFSALPQHVPPGLQLLTLPELIRCVSNGTEELRCYLLKESNIVIECKVCFNLFRNVGHFVAHKRFYCLGCNRDKQKRFCYPSPTFNNETVTVAPDLPTDAAEFMKQSVELAKSNLLKKSSELTEGSSNISCFDEVESKWNFYDRVSDQLDVQKDPTNIAAFRFEPIENTNVAMRVVPLEGSEENVTPTGNGEPNGIEKVSTDLSGGNLDEDYEEMDEKGTLSTSSSERSSPLCNESQDNIPSRTSTDVETESNMKYELADFENLRCLKCHRIMSSKKSLVNHVVNLHGDMKRYYSCPFCKDKMKFRYFWGVIRHLSTIHYMKKPQINKIRSRLRANSWIEKSSGEVVSRRFLCKNKPVIIDSNVLAKQKAAEDKMRLKNEEMAFANDLLQQKMMRGIMPNPLGGRKKFRCESCKKVFAQMKSLQNHLRDCTDWEHVTKPINDSKPNGGQNSKKTQVVSKALTETTPSEESDNPPVSFEVKSSAVVLPKLKPKPVVLNPTDSDKSLEMNTVVFANTSPHSRTKVPATPCTPVHCKLNARQCQAGVMPTLSASRLMPQLKLASNVTGGNTSPQLGKIVLIGSNMGSVNGPAPSNVGPITVTQRANWVTEKSGALCMTAVPCSVCTPHSICQVNTFQAVPTKGMPALLPATAIPSVLCENGAATAVYGLGPANPVCTMAASGSICLTGNQYSVNKPEVVCTMSRLEPLSSVCKGQLGNQDSGPIMAAPLGASCKVTMAPVLKPAIARSQLPMNQIRKLAPNKEVNPQIKRSSDAKVLTREAVSAHSVKIKTLEPSTVQPSTVLAAVPIVNKVATVTNSVATCPKVISLVKTEAVELKKDTVVDKIDGENVIAIGDNAANCGRKINDIVTKMAAVAGRGQNIVAIVGKIEDSRGKPATFEKMKFNQIKVALSGQNGVSSNGVSSTSNKDNTDVKQVLQDGCMKCSLVETNTVSDSNKVIGNKGIINKCSIDNGTEPSHNFCDGTDGALCQDRDGDSPQDESDVGWCHDTKKILHSLIDRLSLKCLQCNRKFSKMSHLRRHAVRHLGWKRYKCKFCSFSNYDRSECKTHIKRRHLGKIAGLTIKVLDFYIVDLKDDSPKINCDTKKVQILAKKKTVKVIRSVSTEDTTVLSRGSENNNLATDLCEDSNDSLLLECSSEQGANQMDSGNLNENQEKQDSHKILALIDAKLLKCLECKREFLKRSHLRRHVVRHLGWKRYKCKQCKFTSYDRSECKSHIERCHLGKVQGLTVNSVNCFIVVLGQPSMEDMDTSAVAVPGKEDEEKKEEVKKETVSNSNTPPPPLPTATPSLLPPPPPPGVTSELRSGKEDRRRSSSTGLLPNSKEDVSHKRSALTIGKATRQRSLCNNNNSTGNTAKNSSQSLPKKAKRTSSLRSASSGAKAALSVDNLSVLNTRKGHYIKPNFLQLAKISRRKAKNKGK